MDLLTALLIYFIIGVAYTYSPSVSNDLVKQYHALSENFPEYTVKVFMRSLKAMVIFFWPVFAGADAYDFVKAMVRKYI